MIKQFALYSLLLMTLAACSTIADAKLAKGTGTKHEYSKPYATVWSATLDAVEKSDLDLVSKNEADGEILAQTSMDLLTYGENVAIYVTKVNEKKTGVEIISKRALATNITATNWETRLFNVLDEKLK